MYRSVSLAQIMNGTGKRGNLFSMTHTLSAMVLRGAYIKTVTFGKYLTVTNGLKTEHFN
jgi:hypothetical protein